MGVKQITVAALLPVDLIASKSDRTHDIARQVRTASQPRHRLASCSAGRWPECAPGPAPEFRDLMTSEAGVTAENRPLENVTETGTSSV
jgi:hypothetical protein